MILGITIHNLFLGGIHFTDYHRGLQAMMKKNWSFFNHRRQKPYPGIRNSLFKGLRMPFLCLLIQAVLLGAPLQAQAALESTYGAEESFYLKTAVMKNADAENNSQGENPAPEESQTENQGEVQIPEKSNTENQAADSGTTPDLGLTAPSVVLMELSTGTVIYERDADTRRSPASITKIMTLILIFDALEAGKIHLTDEVSTSAYASSMGGSQVFLEEGEMQTVETMLKCIVVASANDASVAMAEYIAGSEAEFVRMMNERAAGLGMENTHFEDCCGLSDSDNHYTTARDVALMSRELITKHPQVKEYTTIWMENITHNTRKGTSEFGLSSTNKLLKMSTSFTTTGLKTGSTQKAKYCLSATAEKDGIELAAVVMACPNYKDRFSEAAALLNYGYANCSLYQDTEMPKLDAVPVKNGVVETVKAEAKEPFRYLGTKGEDFSQVTREIVLYEDVQAPLAEGDIVGYAEYSLGEEVLGKVDIVSIESIDKAGFADYLRKFFSQWLL